MVETWQTSKVFSYSSLKNKVNGFVFRPYISEIFFHSSQSLISVLGFP